MASPLKLGIAGLGTVGTSVVRLIERRLRPGSRARGLFGRRRNADVDAVVRRISGIAPRVPAPVPINQPTQEEYT